MIMCTHSYRPTIYRTFPGRLIHRCLILDTLFWPQRQSRLLSGSSWTRVYTIFAFCNYSESVSWNSLGIYYFLLFEYFSFVLFKMLFNVGWCVICVIDWVWWEGTQEGNYLCNQEYTWHPVSNGCFVTFLLLQREVMHSMVMVFAVDQCPSVRLSVRLSCWCIVLKQLNLQSNFFYRLVAPSF